MQKLELRKWQGTIIRILAAKDDQRLIIDCLHRKMPFWINVADLGASTECSEEELHTATKTIPTLACLSPAAHRIAHERYTLIAGMLPFVADERLRTAAIQHISIERNISKQTLRHYLCLFLAFQNIAALAPKEQAMPRPLTLDEKNMRWALNKFYYTKRKISLAAAYSLMLKEKYCDGQGTLLPPFPSIYQFRYFFKNYNKLQTQYISRDGIKDYQRNHRPLLGEGVREFAPSVGVGMLDSTICDIFLVNDAGQLIGRPILTACVDAYSGLCCGYAFCCYASTLSPASCSSINMTYRISCSSSLNSSVSKNSIREIPSPSHRILIVTTPGFLLAPLRIFFTVDGAIPALRASALIAMFRSWQS